MSFCQHVRTPCAVHTSLHALLRLSSPVWCYAPLRSTAVASVRVLPMHCCCAACSAVVILCNALVTLLTFSLHTHPKPRRVSLQTYLASVGRRSSSLLS